jgi:hypothetical protein
MTPSQPPTSRQIKARLLTPWGLLRYAQIPAGAFDSKLGLVDIIKARADAIITVYRAVHGAQRWHEEMRAGSGLSMQALVQAQRTGQLSIPNTRAFDIAFANAATMYSLARKSLRDVRKKYGTQNHQEGGADIGSQEAGAVQVGQVVVQEWWESGGGDGGQETQHQQAAENDGQAADQG